MTATVTPSCANAFLEKIKELDQHLRGIAGGALLQGVGWWQGSRQSSGKLQGLCMIWVGGQLPPPLLCPYVFGCQCPPPRSDHKPAWNGRCSTYTCGHGVWAVACPHPHFMRLRPEQTHHTQTRP